jgi:hypothetical protein
VAVGGRRWAAGRAERVALAWCAGRFTGRGGARLVTTTRGGAGAGVVGATVGATVGTAADVGTGAGAAAGGALGRGATGRGAAPPPSAVLGRVVSVVAGAVVCTEPPPDAAFGESWASATGGAGTVSTIPSPSPITFARTGTLLFRPPRA